MQPKNNSSKDLGKDTLYEGTNFSTIQSRQDPLANSNPTTLGSSRPANNSTGSLNIDERKLVNVASDKPIADLSSLTLSGADAAGDQKNSKADKGNSFNRWSLMAGMGILLIAIASVLTYGTVSLLHSKHQQSSVSVLGKLPTAKQISLSVPLSNNQSVLFDQTGLKTINLNGNVVATGNVRALSFTGNGSNLTNLNASNLTSGTVDDSLLSPDVTLLGNSIPIENLQGTVVSSINGVINNGGDIAIVGDDNISVTPDQDNNSIDLSFTGSTGGGGTVTGVTAGTGLTGGGNSGDVTLSVDNTVTTQGNSFNGNNELVQLTNTGVLPTLDASNLINLDASNITSGTLQDIYLTSNVALKNANNNFTGTNSFSQPLTLQGTTLHLPAGAGASDTFCLATAANCGSSGGSVTSLDSLTGALTINNSSGSGPNITINDASTTQKGIAQFNATNFTDNGSGVINTIQNISNSSSPTFVTINGTTGINTGAGAGTQRIDASGNLVNIGTITSGNINGQTISSSANFTGTVTIQGANALTLGTASSHTGAVIFNNATNNKTLTLQSGVTAANFTLTLPTQDGSNGYCLQTNGSGALSFNSCTGGAAGGVTSIGGLTGVITLDSVFNVSGQNIALNYGSGASNVVEGNTTLSCPAISGTNLTGGGGTITLGAGGSCNNIGFTNSPTFTGTLTVQGAGGVVIGVPGPSGTTGNLYLANSTNANEVLLQGNAPSGSGNATISIPTIAGGSSDTVCLLTLANCVGTGGSVSTTGGTQNYVTKYNNAGANQITKSEIYDNGSGVSIGSTTTTGLFNVGTSAQFQVSSSGALIAVGVNSGTGLIQGTGGLTVGGTVTLSSLNSAGVVHTNGSGVLSTGAVVLGSETSGNYVANIGSVTGLTLGGTNSVAGAAPTFSVNYGSSANTAVQGNVSLTCPAGSGNLGGGGNSITLGTGGSCNAITITNSPTFTGTLTVQGAGGVVIGNPGSQGGNLYLANGTNSNEVLLQGNAPSGSGNATISIPTITGGSSDTVCLLTLANCVGTGGGISGSGTSTKIAVFNGSNSITSSATLTESGSTVTSSGSLDIQGAGGVVIGNPGSQGGNLYLANGTNSNEVLLQGNAPSGSGNATISIPTITGGSSDTVCLLTLANCVGTGGSVSTTGGTQNYVTKYNNAGANQITKSEIYDNGSGVSIGSTTTTGLFNVGTAAQFQVSSSGALIAVGVNSGTGLIQGTGGLTVGGTVTLSSLNSAGVIHTNGSGVLSTSAVVLGSETSGNYVANIGSVTGLTLGGTNSVAGAAPTLSVNYGSSANTAVQGNVTLTCPAGSGNLGGGGNSITLGTGGSCNAITITNSPTFAGTLTVQGAGGVVIGNPGSQGGNLYLANGTNSNEVLLQGNAPSGSGNATISIPTITGGSSDTVCLLTANNCGGLTESGGTQNYVTKFTNAGASQLGNSLIYDNGSGVSIGSTTTTGLFNVGTAAQFHIDSSGNVNTSGTYNGNTFSSSALTFSSGSTASVESASGQGLNVEAQGANTTLLLDTTSSTGTAVTIAATAVAVNIGNASSTNTVNGATTFTGNTNVNKSSSTTAFVVQGSSVLFTADTQNNQVVIGNSGNTVTLNASGGVTLAGTARHPKKIVLTPEYAGAVLYCGAASCPSTDIGTMTANYDSTQKENYYQWTTGQSSNQAYDIVIQIPIPSDFNGSTASGFNGNAPLTIDINTSDTTNGTVVGTLLDTSGTAVTNWNTCALTPTVTGWITSGAGATHGATCNITTGTWTAGGVATLTLALQAPNAGTTKVGDIILNYYSSY